MPLTQTLARVVGKRTVLFSAFRHRNYRFYWAALLAYVIAWFVEFITQSWLVLELTNAPLYLGFLGLSNSVPSIVFSFPGGALADRVDRCKVVMITQGINTLLLLALALLTFGGALQVWHILLVAFATGTVRAFDQPSRQALLPHLIEREDMMNAVALSSTLWQLGRIVGPAIAGVLLVTIGPGACFFVAALAHLGMILLIAPIRLSKALPPQTPQGMLHHMAEGLRFVIATPLFFALVGMTFFNSVFGMSYAILLPVFARDILDVGAQGYGFLQGTSGIGALLGTFMVAIFSGFRPKGWLLLGGSGLFGLSLILFAFSSWYSLSLAIIFLVGWANTFYMTINNTIVQLEVPDYLRGRVMALYGLTWSLIPLGGMISGTIAQFINAPIAVAFGGFMVAALAIAVFATMPTIRRIT